MDSMVRIFIERADNELLAAKSLFKVSESLNLKSQFSLPEKITFYSAVIAHSYYSIFYAAKAILKSKGISTSSPEIHRKTYEQFKNRLVDTGFLDFKLLSIYKKAIIRSDVLLEIFWLEKGKRGRFTYTTIPQTNKDPAEDSLRNAKVFVLNIQKAVGI